MAASALLKQYRIHRERMDGRNFFVKKETRYSGKNCSLRLSTVNCKEKMCLGTTNLDHSPFL